MESDGSSQPANMRDDVLCLFHVQALFPRRHLIALAHRNPALLNHVDQVFIGQVVHVLLVRENRRVGREPTAIAFPAVAVEAVAGRAKPSGYLFSGDRLAFASGPVRNQKYDGQRDGKGEKGNCLHIDKGRLYGDEQSRKTFSPFDAAPNPEAKHEVQLGIARKALAASNTAPRVSQGVESPDRRASAKSEYHARFPKIATVRLRLSTWMPLAPLRVRP